LGLDDETWAKYSVIIRREHECLRYGGSGAFP
jgi:hypothetical protein